MKSQEKKWKNAKKKKVESKKPKKSWTVPQVLGGGVVQVGGPERPGMPFHKK